MGRHREMSLSEDRRSPCQQHQAGEASKSSSPDDVDLYPRGVVVLSPRDDFLPPAQHHMASRSSLRPLLFVASLGNPTSQYAHTLHSAGHNVLKSLALQLRYPPLSSRSTARPPGSVSHPSLGRQVTDNSASPDEDVTSRATLWMSPVLMNVSGPAVLAAWKAWMAATEREDSARQRRLVVLHDDLEMALGGVEVKDGSLSARGHNGIKSLQAAFRGIGPGWKGQPDFVRIRIGIGRPAGREKHEVSNWVLRTMTEREKEVLEGEGVADRVVEALSRVGS